MNDEEMLNQFWQMIKNSNKEGLEEFLISACYAGNLEAVKYLLTSPELNIRPDIHMKRDSPFYFSLFQKHLDVIEYLIFELNIEKTQNITDYLNSPDKEMDNAIINKAKFWFEKKDLNQSLNKNLVINIKNKQITKI